MPPIYKSNSNLNKKKIDNMTLIWLDENISRTDDNYYSMFKLSYLFHNIRTFTRINSFIEYLYDELNEQAILIVSGSFGNKIISEIHRCPLIDSIYIFCQNKIKHRLWSKNYQKIQGVFNDIDFICLYLFKEKIFQNYSKIKSSFNDQSNSFKFIENLQDDYEYEQIKEEFLSYYIDNQPLPVSETIERDFDEYKDENIDSYLMYFSSNEIFQTDDLNDSVQQSQTVVPFIEQKDLKYFDNGIWPCLWWIIKNGNNISKMIGFNRIKHLILHTRIIENVDIYLKLNKNKYFNEENFLVICDLDNIEEYLPKLCYEENVHRIYLHTSLNNIEKSKNLIKNFSKLISILEYSDRLIHMILHDFVFYLIKLGDKYQKENKKTFSNIRYEYALNLQSNIQLFIKQRKKH